jgi:hypothetical protein
MSDRGLEVFQTQEQVVIRVNPSDTIYGAVQSVSASISLGEPCGAGLGTRNRQPATLAHR